ncbi:MAG: TonB C-terminal domain-containing protein [Zoogloeaceae bacterium]|jgi:colicin import membrane protein|nr:TonB C-terminal domain-containing protein [Zoogloeaceae bacterium]
MLHVPLPEPGRRKALLLALAVHLALIAALFLGVQWKTKHATVEVELWSEIPRPAVAHPIPTAPEPRPAVPPAPEPPPPAPVKKADILTPEEPKDRRPEPRPTTPREAPKAKQPPPKESLKDRFDDLFAAEERDMRDRQRADSMAEARAAAAREGDIQQSAAGRRGATEAWIAKIRDQVRGNIVLPPVIEGNPEAVFVMRVRILASGEVEILPGTLRLERGSGNAALDAAAERAILKTSPLPRPADNAAYGSIPEGRMEFRYRPYE